MAADSLCCACPRISHHATLSPPLPPPPHTYTYTHTQERRRLGEAAQAELGVDTLKPDANVATLVQRILKSGVLAHKSVEYRCGCVCVYVG
jgi:hypothetical protein